jgi:hypothetical protein
LLLLPWTVVCLVVVVLTLGGTTDGLWLVFTAVVLRGAETALVWNVRHLSLRLALCAERARFDGGFSGGDGGAEAWWRKQSHGLSIPPGAELKNSLTSALGPEVGEASEVEVISG